MVRRHESELIAPSKPTPHEFKLLSDIDDQRNLRFQIPLIQFYPSNTENGSIPTTWAFFLARMTATGKLESWTVPLPTQLVLFDLKIHPDAMVYRMKRKDERAGHEEKRNIRMEERYYSLEGGSIMSMDTTRINEQQLQYHN
ncbi:hypothetical protein LguiB_033343 [Lonicera macranthoides]